MKQFVVDAFTERIFEGNPAAICIVDDFLSDELSLLIAQENNLSETAFAVKTSSGHYKLRWFTPGGEIDLCGHATLAAAYVIANFYEKEIKEFHFATISGELIVNKKGELFEMDFPSRMPEKHQLSADISAAIGIIPQEVYLARDLMLVLESEADVLNLKPDFSKLKELSVGQGVLVTAKSREYDFVSRTFFPKLGVNEDPVCGSAHCNFIPYWAQVLNKNNMIARQVSPRGGTLHCELVENRVKISGTATLYSVAELYIS